MPIALVATIPTVSVVSIVAVGVIYTICAAIVQRKLSNPKRTRELQDQIKIYSKEINEMMKRNAPKEEISAKQGLMMPLVKQSMMANMKSTVVLIPTFIVVYYLVIPYVFGGLGTAAVAFSIASYNISLAYKGVFFVTVFVLGLITSMSILAYDRRRAKLDTKAKLAAEGIKE
jgi:uncharacterized membrane protein (DUF106 family)